jgi:hypothetical protein
LTEKVVILNENKIGKKELKSLRDIKQVKSFKKNLRITDLILRLLQLFCEGHNEKFMHFLRE